MPVLLVTRGFHSSLWRLAALGVAIGPGQLNDRPKFQFLVALAQESVVSLDPQKEEHVRQWALASERYSWGWSPY